MNDAQGNVVPDLPPGITRADQLQADLEMRPSADQKQRLEDFLTELMAITRRYGMLITAEPVTGEPVILDIDSDTIVGVDFFFAVDETNHNRVLMYTCESSILDGVWLVEADDGTWQQQRYSPHDWGEPPA